MSSEMSHIIVTRSYRPGDEISCKEIIKAGVMSSLNLTFFGIVFKELTFQMMILFAAIMFIFFGLPLTVCLLVVPLVVFFVYVGTYIGFTTKAMEVNEELSNIPRIYMSNAFSCFWVAEAFNPYLMTESPENVQYTIMTEQQFRNSNIDISSRVKQIVEQGYGCANIVASEYTEHGRKLCLKRGFELELMYHKPILGSFVTILTYELTYQIKPGEDEYVPPVYNKAMLNK
ncbi:uncharacterized protein LOC143207468 isoform X2 [Lasioglossum baleicum]|uniref:uncharacterized protein LOC143207468 isoform X2 n=1 Tax=Lasioglossum baleicum TaxID=434251 RepID=UPI003FCCD336